MQYTNLEQFLEEYGSSLEKFQAAIDLCGISSFEPSEFVKLPPIIRTAGDPFYSKDMFNKTLMWNSTVEGSSFWGGIHDAFRYYMNQLTDTERKKFYVRKDDDPQNIKRYKPEELSEIHGYSTRCTLDEL